MAALAKRIPVYEYEFEDELVPANCAEAPAYLIGAHADYNRDDYLFPRVQSREMREMAWESRIRPMKSWSELIGMGLVLSLLSAAAVLSTASFV